MKHSTLSSGDALPLGIREPTDGERERAKRRLRHHMVEAPEASGTLYGVPVGDFTETDRALAFNLLWDMLQRSAPVRLS